MFKNIKQLFNRVTEIEDIITLPEHEVGGDRENYIGSELDSKISRKEFEKEIKELRENVIGEKNTNKYNSIYESIWMRSMFAVPMENKTHTILERLDALEKYLNVTFTEEKKEFKGYKSIKKEKKIKKITKKNK